MPSNHLIFCRPLLLLPSIFPSIRVFSNESALCIRWLKYWSFSFSISPSNEHPGLISLDGIVGSPCSLKDSQESSPTPQFKSITSSALSFLYSPTLTSIHDHWKNHSLDNLIILSLPIHGRRMFFHLFISLISFSMFYIVHCTSLSSPWLS